MKRSALRLVNGGGHGDTMLDGSELARWTVHVSRKAHALASTDPTWDTVHVEDELIGRIDAKKHGALLAIQRHEQEMNDRGISIQPAEPTPRKPAQPRHPVAAEIMNRLAGLEDEIEERAVALALWGARAKADWPLIECLAALVAYNDARVKAAEPVEIIHPPTATDPIIQESLKQQLRVEHPEAYAALHPETHASLDLKMGRGNVQHLMYAYEVLRSGAADTDQFDDRWQHEMIDRFSGDHHIAL